MTKKLSKQEAINIVKKKLWSYGYRVQQYYKGFDLLVDNNYQINVERVSSLKRFDSNYDKNGIYAIAIVVVNDLPNYPVLYHSPVDSRIYSSPYKIFGKPIKYQLL